MLVVPRFDGVLTLRTDACNRQVLDILLQSEPDRTDHLVEYLSRSLKDAMKAYDTTHRECGVMVWSNIITLFTDLWLRFHSTAGPRLVEVNL